MSQRPAPDPAHLSRMVGYSPCQLQQPWVAVVLLLATFCCWYCWMEDVLLLAEADGTSFLVGNSSAAILLQSDRRPGHGSSGARQSVDSTAEKHCKQQPDSMSELQLN